MKVFVTGVNGQLGHDIMNELLSRGHEAVGSGRAAVYSGADDNNTVGSLNCGIDYIQLDITDATAVERVIGEIRPDAVIHCAAWTAVDDAEDEDKRDAVWKVNAESTANIARICSNTGAKMLYTSTDYVFNGRGDKPWTADCKAFEPLNVYGASKLAGEKAVEETIDKFFIVRIAWVFGKNGKNFIKTMLDVAKSHDNLKVVDDQIGTPTYTVDLARLVVDMIESEKYGYYHATNEGGFISWYDFTKEIFRQAVEMGHSEYSEDMVNVTQVTTEEYGVSKAVRPFNSRLDKSKLVECGFEPLPVWKDALRRYLAEIADEF